MLIRYCIGLAAVVSLVVSAGCQGANPAIKFPSAAGSVADVAAAWDMHCTEFRFYACPNGVQSEATCTETLGDLYFGSDFEWDSDLLMQAIQYEVSSEGWPDPDPDDLLNAVLTDPIWFK